MSAGLFRARSVRVQETAGRSSPRARVDGRERPRAYRAADLARLALPVASARPRSRASRYRYRSRNGAGSRARVTGDGTSARRSRPMKGFYQAGRSAMSAAAQAANGTLPAGCKFEHHDAMDSGSATASRVPSPGDDAFSAEPGAHLIVRVLSARGLDAHPAFVSLRVASALGEVRGARARTLAARPAPGVRAHVWRTARDLRCEPREGDVLLAEVTSGSPDAVDRHAIESGVVARACVALAALPPDGASVRVPLHRNLRAITDVSAEPGGGPPATLTLARVPANASLRVSTSSPPPPPAPPSFPGVASVSFSCGTARARGTRPRASTNCRR